eukprot:UN03866
MIDWDKNESYKQRKNSIKLNESTTQTLFDDNDPFFDFDDINNQNHIGTQQNNQKQHIMDLFNGNNETKINSNAVQSKQPQQDNIFTSFEYPQQQQQHRNFIKHATNNKQCTIKTNLTT